MIAIYISNVILSLLSFSFGWYSNNDFLIYYLPGLLSMVNAILSTYVILIKKENLGTFIIYFGNFIFYYLQIINPSNYQLSVHLMHYLSDKAIFYGSLVIITQPILMHGSMLVWMKCIHKRIANWYATPTNNINSFYKYFLFFFVLLFIINFTLQAITGQVVISALRTIVNLRTEIAYEGLPGIFSSLTFLMATSVSLFFANIYLFKSKFKLLALLVLPFSTIWFFSILLSGTRTIIIMSIMGLFVYITRRFKFSFLSIAISTILMILTFLLSQYSYKFRYVGAKDIETKEFLYDITEIQGLENYYDQCRSFNYYLDDYSDFWFFKNETLSGLFSFVFRPIDMVIFWIPRSMWSGKPLDPTFVEFTRYSLYTVYGYTPEAYTSYNLSYDTGFGTNNTAGILGRDLMRFGWMGPLSTLVWFGLFLALANSYYILSYKRFECILIALAFTGTCFAMFRDLSPGWTIQFSSLIIITHFSLVLSKK